MSGSCAVGLGDSIIHSSFRHRIAHSPRLEYNSLDSFSLLLIRDFTTLLLLTSQQFHLASQGLSQNGEPGRAPNRIPSTSLEPASLPPSPAAPLAISSQYYAQKHQQIHIRPDARGEAERVGPEAADGTKAAGQGDQTGPFTDDDWAVTPIP